MRLLPILPVLLLTSSLPGEEAELNVAHPDRHDYVTTGGNRERHQHTEAEVNEARVYDFYQRQADHYMASAERPDLVPAFPGLDGGVHGHWGLHSQNQHEDGRWNDIDLGFAVGHTLREGKDGLGKAVSLRLDGLFTCFDPESLTYPMVWQGDFIRFDPFRWGSSRNASPDGDLWWHQQERDQVWSRDGEPFVERYRGYYRHEGRAVFSFELDGQPVLSHPSSFASEALVVTLHFASGFDGGTLDLGILPSGVSVAVRQDGGGVTLTREEGRALLKFDALPAGMTVAYAIGKTAQRAVTEAGASDLTSWLKGGSAQWKDETVTTRGETAADDNAPYVIDTLTVPESTPFNSVMQLSGVGFVEDGSALVTTLAGEVWKVDGIDESLDSLRWSRFASGLHQPLGMHVDEEGIFIMERGQITRLQDLNGDGEADFYECYANDFDGRDKSHTHCFGLERDEDGGFYFVNWKDILRSPTEGATQHFAFGVRNCMGFGKGAGGEMLAGPQEGTYTPTSMVIELTEGEFYGHPGDFPGETIAPPLCFVPRGIDNSTGGFLASHSEDWGPLSGHTIGLSYGYATHYLILRDDSTSRAQGAVVPLEGDFLSGVLRGAMSPTDGQMYLVGLDGWGDYSVRDGCFQRVRYTGAPVRQPIGFQVHANGIRVDFSTALDVESGSDPSKVFVQQWDYEYAERYGSPEFSKRQPDSLGHDVLDVASVRVLESGRSLFIEIPEIEPVMQMHLRFHLKDEEGVAFKTDLFPTVLELGDRFEAPGLLEPVTGKDSRITLRVKDDTAGSLHTESGEVIEGEREIVLKCSEALKFATNLIEARAGEPLKLVFENPDIMPHNVVFVTQGHLSKVGNLSFSMLNDPKAAEKHYTPDVEEVIAGTHLVMPGGSHVLHFSAPTEPGDHHFVCTFPGHWMTMNGVFRVTE